VQGSLSIVGIATTSEGKVVVKDIFVELFDGRESVAAAAVATIDFVKQRGSNRFGSFLSRRRRVGRGRWGLEDWGSGRRGGRSYRERDNSTVACAALWAEAEQSEYPTLAGAHIAGGGGESARGRSGKDCSVRRKMVYVTVCIETVVGIRLGSTAGLPLRLRLRSARDGLRGRSCRAHRSQVALP